MNTKLRFSLLIFLLGFAGVLSVLASEIPLPAEVLQELQEILTPSQIKIVILIQPTILLIGATIIGLVTFKKAGFNAPIFEQITKFSENKLDLKKLTFYGVVGGLIAGVLIVIVSEGASILLREKMIALEQKIDLSPITRFLYGGITEEVLMRFGIMSLIVFITQKITNSQKAITYWIAIIISSVIFALAHLPVAMASTDLTIGLFIYILIGNSTGGFIFGWLYWKKGLESAMIAHIFCHVILILTQ